MNQRRLRLMNRHGIDGVLHRLEISAAVGGLPVIQAGVLVITAVYAFANLGADILYTLLNPRIRYHATAD